MRIYVLLFILFATAINADEMRFYFTGNGGNCIGCEWVEAQGEITANTPAHFAEFVDSLRGGGSVAFDSVGGDPDAAMALGRMIRERGWDTDRRELGTPNGADPSRATICRGACLLAFMGGVSRDIDVGIAGEGVFNPRLTVDGAEAIPWISAEVLEYTLDMGVSAEVLTMAAKVPFGETFDFSPEDYERLGLDNTKFTTDPWFLEPYKAGLVLATKQRYQPSHETSFTLFCRVEDPRLHILISKPGDYSDFSFPEGTVFSGSIDPSQDPTRFGPRFILNGERYPLNADGVEFIRQSEAGLTASLRLPDILPELGGEELSFDPNLGRVFGGILDFSLPLPPAPWIAVARRNCI